MHQMNQKCTSPLLLWHMLLEFRGISITGQRIGAAVKAYLPESTYTRKKEELITSYAIFCERCNLTTDNFNKSWPSPTLSMTRSTQYINTNFTVNALCEIENRPKDGYPLVALDVKENIYLPSIPSKLKELKWYGKLVSHFFLTHVYSYHF